jgi:hypothetical protein
MCSLIVDAGVVPPASATYPYFVAVQCGLTSATCICLMINGFVGFQLYEDGTKLSVWLLRTCSVAMFLISFAVSLLTFKSWGGLGPENTVGLFVVVYLFSALFLFVYVVMQILLVIGTLQERWPLWHIGFGVLALVLSQVILYAFSEVICTNVEHYVDGLFFATLLNLLAVMMVYKVCTFQWLVMLEWFADNVCSIGIASRGRTWSSRLELSTTTGRSRTTFLSTTMRAGATSMVAATTVECSTNPATVLLDMEDTNLKAAHNLFHIISCFYNA